MRPATIEVLVGAILMSASTVIVALNAQLLRRTDLRPADRAAPVGVLPATGIRG